MGVAYLHHIYLHEGLLFIWSMHKCTSPMDPMGKSTPCFAFSSTFWNRFCPLTKVTKLSDSSFPTLPHIHCAEVLFFVFRCFCRSFVVSNVERDKRYKRHIFNDWKLSKGLKVWVLNISCWYSLLQPANLTGWWVLFFFCSPLFGGDSQFD